VERVQAVRKEEERIAQEEMYAEAARIEEKRAENVPLRLFAEVLISCSVLFILLIVFFSLVTNRT